MDRPEAGTVPGGHVLVEALDGISTAEVAELLVHVVGTRSRVVAKPDTEVLDLQGLLFVDLKKGRRTSKIATRGPCGQQSHSACLLRAARDIKIHTTLTPMISPLAFLTFLSCLRSVGYGLDGVRWRHVPQEIPEARLGDDLIGRKNAHAVDLGGGLCLGGQVASNDLIFGEAHSVRREEEDD